MFTLIIEDKYGAIVDEYSFEDGEFVIGRSQSCDIVLAADNVSRRHARLFTVEGRCYVEDLKAANGLWLNGKRVYNVTELPRSAQVRIGDFFLHIEGAAFDRPMGAAPFARLVPTPGGHGQVAELTRPTTLIGRGKDCTIVVNDPSVSRIHGKITRDADGRVMVEDLRSSNGVYVNERRVDVQELRHGDRVRFGTVGFTLQFEGDEHIAAPPEAVYQEPPRPTHSTGGFRPAPPISSYGNDYGASGYYDQRDPYAPPQQRSWLPQVAMFAVALLSVVGLIVLMWFAYQRFIAPALDESRERSQAKVAREIKDKADAERAVIEAAEAKQKARLGKLFASGKVAISKRKWSAAERIYKEARSIDPIHTEPTRALNLIAAERRAKSRFDKSERAFADKRYPEAIRLHRRIPDSSVYRADANAALKAIAGLLENHGDHACDRKEWQACKDKYSVALSTTFASAEVEEKFAKVLKLTGKKKKKKRRRRGR